MWNFKNFFLSVTTQMKKRTLMKKWKFLYLLTKILVCRKLTFNNPTTFLNIPSERRYWMWEHDQHWFERLWEHKNETIFEELWKCEFRLKIETFQICSEPCKEWHGMLQHFLVKYNSSWETSCSSYLVSVNRKFFPDGK